MKKYRKFVNSGKLCFRQSWYFWSMGSFILFPFVIKCSYKIHKILHLQNSSAMIFLLLFGKKLFLVLWEKIKTAKLVWGSKLNNLEFLIGKRTVTLKNFFQKSKWCYICIFWELSYMDIWNWKQKNILKVKFDSTKKIDLKKSE